MDWVGGGAESLSSGKDRQRHGCIYFLGSNSKCHRNDSECLCVSVWVFALRHKGPKHFRMAAVFILSDTAPLTLVTQMKEGKEGLHASKEGSNQSHSLPSLPVFPAGMSRHLGDPVAHAVSQDLMSSKESVCLRKLV